MRPIHVGLVAIALLTITGCSARQHYKSGLDAELTGRDWVAAQEYAEALADRPKKDKTRRALLRVAEDGFHAGLSRAERLASRSEFLEAKSVYDDLDRFVDLLDNHGLRDFDAPDLEERSSSMWSAGVAQRFDKGQRAYRVGEYREAIDHFRWVQNNAPDHRDLGEAQDLAWSAWAYEAEGSGSWRLAITRHDRAHDTERAAAVHQALGEWFASNGHCRAAVEDWEDSVRLASTSERRDGLSDAIDCATVDVLVEDFRDRSNRRLDGLDTGRLLRDAVLSELDDDVSDYVRFIDPRMASGSDIDFTIRTVVLDGDIDSWRDLSAETGTGWETGVCEGQPCEREVQLGWTEVTHHLRAELLGTVTVLSDTGSSRTHSFREDSTEDRTWAIDLSGPTGVRLPGVLESLLTVEREPPHRRDAAYAVIDETAADIAHFVHSVVDGEREARDPRFLELPVS